MAEHALPKLPGYSYTDPTKTRHARRTGFEYRNGYAIPKTGAAEEINDDDVEQLQQLTAKLTYGHREAGRAPPATAGAASHPATSAGRQPGGTGVGVLAASGRPVPAHIAFDKKVLCFLGYFKQTVPESPDEHYRVRYVKVFYYLEDDTIAVTEPPIPNSGLMQGKLIKRQQMPKDNKGNIYTWKDLNVGISVNFYGRVIRLASCDEFTRKFLLREGVELGEPEEMPEDPYLLARAPIDKPDTTTVSKSDFDRLKQFIVLDRKVLRFYAVWDDRTSTHGDLRSFVIHYFLVDDTIEVLERQRVDMDRSSVLVKRQRIARDPKDLPADFPSAFMAPTNALENFLGVEDFAIGETVVIFSRPFVICSMDQFTQDFYRRNFGVENFEALDLGLPPVEVPIAELAPYHGFGTPEDSMQSCLSIAPKPPKKNMLKLLQHENKVLRFSAHLDSDKREDAGRTFIVSYRLADDTIAIHEPPQKNSGMLGGRFLEPTKLLKPGSSKSMPEYFTEQDLYLGMKLPVFGHTFILDDADEFVLHYMEENSDQFKPEHIETLRSKRGASASQQ